MTRQSKRTSSKKACAPTFYNSLTGRLEKFTPLDSGKVKMYHCGPTVYNFAHIGNIRPYITADLLKRMFLYFDYEVTQIINITDVGHLQSDGDEGEDKVEIGARREGKSALEITEKYARAFFEDLAALGVDTNGTIFPRATAHIGEQIALIKILEEKGYTYKTGDGIYFNTGLMPDYGVLGSIKNISIREGARIGINSEKKDPHDFALWKFSPVPSSGALRREQEWPSPWGIGFPGWHIECSAMAMQYLGDTFDIHTGGIDHLPVHHNNEIAQSQSATGEKLANYWMHSEFITVEGKKISKSLGNSILVKDLKDRAIHPLALRYWFLGAHYRSPINFTWDAIKGADTALRKLYKIYKERLDPEHSDVFESPALDDFMASVSHDLDTPKSLAILWQVVNDEKISGQEKKFLFVKFDKILGLGISRINRELGAATERVSEADIPLSVMLMLKDRETARAARDFERADSLRDRIKREGFNIIDDDDGPILYRVSSEER